MNYAALFPPPPRLPFSSTHAPSPKPTHEQTRRHEVKVYLYFTPRIWQTNKKKRLRLLFFSLSLVVNDTPFMYIWI